MLSRERVAELLLDMGAVMVNTRVPFKYASGLVSPVYVDCSLLASRPKERSAVLETMVEQVNSLGVAVDIVIGAGTSGVWLASDLSGRLRVPMAYLRASAKDHGTKKRVEGADFHISQKVLLVSGIASAEQDLLEALQAVESAGASPIGCISVFTNNIELLEPKSIPLLTVTDVETMLSVALSRGDISSDDKTHVAQWLADPTKWSSSIKREIVHTWDESKDKVADILISIGAVSFAIDSPYKFSSGLLSPIYLDTRRLISFPIEWEDILSFFEKVIVERIKHINVVAGIAMGGLPHATRLASRLGIPMAYVESSPKEYGKRTRIGGYIEPDDCVVVVDDIVTTGRSIISGVTSLRDAGGVINDCLAIVTYDMQDARETFERGGLSLYTLTNLTSLVKVAKRRGMLSNSQATAISTWQKNPWNWTQLQLAGDFSNG